MMAKLYILNFFLKGKDILNPHLQWKAQKVQKMRVQGKV